MQQSGNKYHPVFLNFQDFISNTEIEKKTDVN